MQVGRHAALGWAECVWEVTVVLWWDSAVLWWCCGGALWWGAVVALWRVVEWDGVMWCHGGGAGLLGAAVACPQDYPACACCDLWGCACQSSF